MKLGFIGFAVLCISAVIYIFLFESQNEAPLQKDLDVSKQSSKESIPFSSKSLAVVEPVSKPLEVSSNGKIGDEEIKELEKEMTDSIGAYNQSVVAGQPDTDAIEKIAELKEKYKQRAIQGVQENN